MELSKALSLLIKQEGILILKHPMLVNHLMDLQAFEDMPASRYLVKTLHEEGCFKTLYLHKSSHNELQSYWDETYKYMTVRWGFRADVAEYVASQVADAMGLSHIAMHTQPVKSNQVASVNTGKHLCFKGIEIAGGVEQAAIKLSHQGFIISSQDKISVTLRGTFAGVDECDIYLLGSNFISELYTICVFFPKKDSWWVLKSDYEKFKALLTDKYGQPQSYEFFEEPYFEGDNYEMTALSNGKAVFASVFKLDLGEVRISIAQEANVLIIYEDAFNKSRIEECKDVMAHNDL